jgi:BirA family biotin operon repressor/biotin-[acetyl-CoA-carboxylase] ligase
VFDLAALEIELADTVYAGNLHFSRTTSSTNHDALVAARLGAPHGSVYFADEQTAGRGRGDHSWHSAAGEGLYVSVLLRPQLGASRLALIPLAAGLAAAEAVHAASGLTVDLRWPNYLLIGPRKTGGILIEARNDSKSLPHAVVTGIGINVHQCQFAPGLATPATSLDLEAGHRISRQSLLLTLLKSLQDETSGLTNVAAPNAILARVEKASTWIRGRYVQVHGPQACEGMTAGLDQNGFLRVKSAAGIVTVQTGGLRAAEKTGS